MTVDVYAAGDDKPSLRIDRDLPDLQRFVGDLACRLPPHVSIDTSSKEFDEVLATHRPDAA